MEIHWDILDDVRKSILPLLKDVSSDGFYLAGGTGLALQIGHRDSIDFDFFKEGNYDTAKLIQKIETVFVENAVVITQQETNTVSCLIDNKIQLSFFGYKYPLLQPVVQTEYFSVASVADIGCMKLAAITSRSLEKDYVDLYFILRLVHLVDLLKLCRQKYHSLDTGLILKSLAYFDDVQPEPILFKGNNKVEFEVIKTTIQSIVADYFKIKA